MDEFIKRASATQMIKHAALIKLVASIAITVGLGLGCRPAYGWLRAWYEDITVVERSELIVVGHLKRGSVISASPGQGFTQYHALLAITSVLKGPIEEPQIPVIIYYGLTPMVGAYINDGGIGMDWRPIDTLNPLDQAIRNDAIAIMDTAEIGGSLEPLVPDAADDNLWFLRRRAGNDGREAGTGDFGIVDPQDLQPLSLQDYFLAYLSADPEPGVRAQLALHPPIARRAQRYLDHLEVQRILALPEPETRIQRLLPFYIKGQSWSAGPPTHRFEARSGIIDCGEVSAPYLQQLFVDPQLVRLRKDIIDIWGELRFEGCIKQLVELLGKHDQFLSGQRLDEDWSSHDSTSDLARQRRRIYDEVYSSVVVLGKIGDESAISAINQTRATWDPVNTPLNRGIVKQCDEALRLIEERKHDAEK